MTGLVPLKDRLAAQPADLMYANITAITEHDAVGVGGFIA
jgi:hypothetical protein